MKSILMPVRPKWVAKILNGEKTVEIRKTAPKEWVDYLNCKANDKPEPMIVDIYCTKDKQGLWLSNGKYDILNENKYVKSSINGKVVARFTLNKVEEISWQMGVYELEQQWFSDFLDKCCLSFWELKNYLNRKNGYAWHISNLEIFGDPKELSEFYTLKCNQKKEPCNIKDVFGAEECHRLCKLCKSLTKAPQSWCYVEEREDAK